MRLRVALTVLSLAASGTPVGAQSTAFPDWAATPVESKPKPAKAANSPVQAKPTAPPSQQAAKPATKPSAADMNEVGRELRSLPLLSTVEPEMTVTIVRSAKAGCHPNCFEWISAEGRIDRHTKAKFEKVFREMGKKKLPIMIHSGGGSVDQALSIGRMIRARGLDVFVTKTSPVGYCDPKRKDCPDGVPGMRGNPNSQGSICASSCVFVLASGVNRLAGVGTGVGLHQIVIHRQQVLQKYRVFSRREWGVPVVVKRELMSQEVISTTTKQADPTDSTYTRIRKYFAEMGIGASVMSILMSADHTSMRWLKASELDSLRLRTGAFTGNDWVDQSVKVGSPQPHVVVPSNTPFTTAQTLSIAASLATVPARLPATTAAPIAESPGTQSPPSSAAAKVEPPVLTGSSAPSQFDLPVVVLHKNGIATQRPGIEGDDPFAPIKLPRITNSIVVTVPTAYSRSHAELAQSIGLKMKGDWGTQSALAHPPAAHGIEAAVLPDKMIELPSIIAVDGDWGARLSAFPAALAGAGWQLGVVLEVGSDWTIVGLRPADGGDRTKREAIPLATPVAMAAMKTDHVVKSSSDDPSLVGRIVLVRRIFASEPTSPWEARKSSMQ